MLANVAMGVVAPLLWERLAPYQQTPAARVPRPVDRSARVGLPRHPVAGRDRLGRMVRKGIHGRDAEAARVSSRAAHRLHLRRRRRGARASSASLVDAGRLSLPACCASYAIAARANDGFSSLVAFGLAVELARARAGEHRHDAEPHADHRHPAAVLQLRRLVPAGVAGWRSGSSCGSRAKGAAGRFGELAI